MLTLINLLILWDVGFQLSFMASLGLILLVLPLERGIYDLLQHRLKPEQVGLAIALLSELVVVTLAHADYHQPADPLPFWPLLAHLAIHEPANFAGAATYQDCGWIGHLGRNVLAIVGTSPGLAGLASSGLDSLDRRVDQPPAYASLDFWGTAVGALLVWLVVVSLPDGRLHVAFLDVGQGDVILIRPRRVARS